MPPRLCKNSLSRGPACAFAAAVASPAFRALTQGEAARFPHHPGLYTVIRT